MVFGSDISWELTIIGIIFGAQNYFLVRTIFVALANIPASLYFIASRITLSLALLVIGLVFFGDSISNMEYIGFFLGFVIFALLVERDKTTEANYKVGLYALAGSILLMILGHTIVKYTAHRVENIFYLHTIVSITGALLAYNFARPKISFSYPNLKEIISWGALYGLLYGFTINFVYAAYKGNDLAITFKVLSYSLIVSIVLSQVLFTKRSSPLRKFWQSFSRLCRCGFSSDAELLYPEIDVL